MAIGFDKRVATAAVISGMAGSIITFALGTLSAGEKLGRWSATLERLDGTFPIIESNKRDLAVVQAVCCSEMDGRKRSNTSSIDTSSLDISSLEAGEAR